MNQWKPPAVLLPISASRLRRRNEPNSASIEAPGSEKPLLVRSERAPPSVLRPKRGFDPGISAIELIAARGIRSQFTLSPKGSLTRTPSRYTERPCGVPSSGLAVKPR